MLTTQTILNTINPKKNYKKILTLSAIILGILLLFILIIIWWQSRPPKITYQTQKIVQGDIQSSISASGTLSPTNEVSIGSVISGLVIEVLVDVNDKVQKDQILARIDSESIEQNLQKYQAQLSSAKAQLTSSQIALEEKRWQYNQLKSLYEKTQGKTPSRLELQTARTNYNAALSEIELRKSNIKEIETAIASTQVDLKNTHITSPIDGIVLSRSIEVGQSVAASFQAPEFFIIAESLEEMDLIVNVSEADIGKVKEGQKVTFSVDSYPQKEFQAVVNRVNFGASSSSDNIVSYETKIFIENKDLLLRPGMSATADIQTAFSHNAKLVPSQALYFNPTPATNAKKESPKSSFNLFSRPKPPKVSPTNQRTSQSTQGVIWILQKGEPVAKEVQVGISNGTLTEIISDDLSLDSEVILSIKNDE